jgi:hypothetical protein
LPKYGLIEDNLTNCTFITNLVAGATFMCRTIGSANGVPKPANRPLVTAPVVSAAADHSLVFLTVGALLSGRNGSASREVASIGTKAFVPI